MSKKILPLCIFLSLIFSKSYSQDFLGLSTGNYSGITGITLQPANIVDSRHKFDINLFSTGLNYSNNYFLLDKDVLLKFNKNKFNNYASFKDAYLTEASLPQGEKVFFNVTNRTQLPLSFMATTGKKSAIALNMQLRTIIQGRGISQDLAKLAFNDFYPPLLNNTSVDASGIHFNSLSWAEIGFTYGKVLFSSDKHFLKAAVTGKYLAGLSSINFSSNDIQLRVNGDSTFNFTSPSVNYNHNENADFNNLFDKNLSADANSFGLDAGLVYEYRGNIDKFKYLKTDDEHSYDALRRDVNKYIFKLGVSLLDVGMFQFDKPANVNSFSANINNWALGNGHFNSIKDFDTALAARVIANPNDPGRYNVYMPTALSAQLDVKFVKGLFLNVMSYWPVNLGDEPGQRFDKFGYYTITPRFETRHFGVYIPYTVTQRNDFTDYKQHLLGATVRVGPIFVGSSNLGSMLFNNKLRSADVHVGLKIGFTYGKPNKSTRVLSTIFKEEQAATFTKVEPQKEYEPDLNRKRMLRGDSMNTVQNSNNLLLDYSNGKIFDNPGPKPNVIVINNYYYGSPTQKVIIDSISLPNDYPTYGADSLRIASREIARLQNKLFTDSISRVTKDSLQLKRQQLDSLIKSMQQLQRQMDSTSRIETNAGSDSSVSYNNLSMERSIKAGDSLKFENDSLQMIRGEALMTRTIAFEKDSARTGLSAQNVQPAADKKKIEPALDSSITENKSVPLQTSKTDTANLQKNKEVVYRQSMQRLQDSLDNLSNRYSFITDSLTRAKAYRQVGTNNPVLLPEERSALAATPVQEYPNAPDNKEYQRMQDRQNELYSQYARQAEGLSRDIDRLNSRMVTERRNDRRNNSYIPVPIPVNNYENSKRQERVEVMAPAKTDTVYIRDSIIIKDSLRIRDTVINIQSNSYTSRPPLQKRRIDTVLIRETVAQPTFDYASFPEENILFALGQSSFQPIYENRLNFIAGILLKNTGLQVRITGHTDSTGSRAINEKLSLQRAENVAYYLMEKGVSQKQVKVNSETFKNPAVSGNSKSARSQNRRVSLKIETRDDQTRENQP